MTTAAPYAPTLLVLAAGGGRRYGGLKQLAPIGPHGEPILAYSIGDALSVGFGKVVLVIRREHESLFRETFVDRLANVVDVQFVFQDGHVAVPTHVRPPAREKPWGTAHAVLCARGAIHTPFAVLNADDFYGRAAIAAMADYLRESRASSPLEGAVVGYPLHRTLSDFGPVSRGLCRIDEHGMLQRIEEHHRIERRGTRIVTFAAEGKPWEIGGESIVSLNLWGLRPELFDCWEEQFRGFLASSPAADREFEIPRTVQRMIDECKLQVRVLPTDTDWFGLTHAADLPVAQRRIAALVAQGTLPPHLWPS